MLGEQVCQIKSCLGHIRCTYFNASFLSSSLENALFYTSRFKNIVFDNSDLNRACFNGSEMVHSQILHCDLTEANLLEMKIKASVLTNSILENTFLGYAANALQINDCTENVFTKPVIALAWNFEYNQNFASRIKRVLLHQNAIPLVFEYENGQINGKVLHCEVKLLASEISENPVDDMLSVPVEIFKRAERDSQIIRINEIVAEVFVHAQGLLLPGGEDIQPVLYGKKPERSGNDEDFLRSITEIAAINNAYENQIPILGICRGSQIVNVRNGGDLIQHVDDHFDEEHFLKIDFSVGKAALLMEQIMGSETIRGLSMHHQASQKIGKGLNRVLHHEGVTEALISDDGNVILTQFHPETYLNHEDKGDPGIKANENIFRYFIARASETKPRGILVNSNFSQDFIAPQLHYLWM